jgi:glycosyltransferase involved in cell wall biosynthesis
MHAGLPIVCTPVGGIAETVVDEVSGIVVPVDDVGALASATVALARNAKRRQAMGRAARMRADAFTADRMVGAIEDVYRAVGAPAHRTGPVEPEPLRAPWTFDGGAR